MKKPAAAAAIIFLFVFLSGYAYASPEVYNRGEKVELSHEMEYVENEYYIHYDDLPLLGLTTSKESIDKGYKYTIEAKDAFGTDKGITVKITDKSTVISPGEIILPDGTIIVIPDGGYTKPNMPDLPEISYDELPSITINPDKVHRINRTSIYYNVNVTATKRSLVQIGERKEIYVDSILSNGFYYDNDNAVYVNDEELYINANFIGEKLSHEYSINDEKISFYIADEDFGIFETNLFRQAFTSVHVGGHKVNVYTARRISEGDSLDNFEIIKKTELIIPEGENKIKGIIEIPGDKAASDLYYIADYGERFAFMARECDFSEVGEVVVYPWQKDVTYKASISLPEADSEDVSFTVRVYANNVQYEVPGVIKAGELTADVFVRELPFLKSFRASVIFDTKRYKNSWLGEGKLQYGDIERDFGHEHTAVKATEYICNVSLPEGFECDEDVSLTLSIRTAGSFVVTDGLNDTDDTALITLNNENRQKTITLYANMTDMKIQYELTKSVDGLCDKGYLSKNFETSSHNKSIAVLNEGQNIDITLLRKGNVRVIVKRPDGADLSEDIFSSVYLTPVYENVTNSMIELTHIKYDSTPLIAAGKESGEMLLEIEEDQRRKIEIRNITGDDGIYDLCYYVEDGAHPIERKKQKMIFYDIGVVEIELPASIVVSGEVADIPEGAKCFVAGECTLPRGEIFNVETMVEDGTFLLKIPYGIGGYRLCAYTQAGVRSYYVDNNTSTSNIADTLYVTELKDAENICLKYIVQNPLLPVKIEMDSSLGVFNLKKISDSEIGMYSIYMAYYDVNDRLLKVEKEDDDILDIFFAQQESFLKNYPLMKKIRMYVWSTDGMVPLAEPAEYIAPKPALPIDVCIVEDFEECELHNNSEATIENFNLYIAYYDKNGTLLKVKKHIDTVGGYDYEWYRVDFEYPETDEIKVLVWGNNSMIPLSNVAVYHKKV